MRNSCDDMWIHVMNFRIMLPWVNSNTSSEIFVGVVNYMTTPVCLYSLITECQCSRIFPRGSDWRVVSKPNCPATLKSISCCDERHGRGKFSIGKYECIHHYEHSSASGNFSLACPVLIRVRGRSSSFSTVMQSSAFAWKIFNVFNRLMQDGLFQQVTGRSLGNLQFYMALS